MGGEATSRHGGKQIRKSGNSVSKVWDMLWRGLRTATTLIFKRLNMRFSPIRSAAWLEDVSGVCSVFDSGPAQGYPSLRFGQVTGQRGSDASTRCVCSSWCLPLPSFFFLSWPVQLLLVTQYWRLLQNLHKACSNHINKCPFFTQMIDTLELSLSS